MSVDESTSPLRYRDYLWRVTTGSLDGGSTIQGRIGLLVLVLTIVLGISIPDFDSLNLPQWVVGVARLLVFLVLALLFAHKSWADRTSLQSELAKSERRIAELDAAAQVPTEQDIAKLDSWLFQLSQDWHALHRELPAHGYDNRLKASHDEYHVFKERQEELLARVMRVTDRSGPLNAELRDLIGNATRRIEDISNEDPPCIDGSSCGYMGRLLYKAKERLELRNLNPDWTSSRFSELGT